MRCGGDEDHSTATIASATPRARWGTESVTQKCVTQNRAGTKWDGDETDLSLRGFFRHPTSCPYRGIPLFCVDPAVFRANQIFADFIRANPLFPFDRLRTPPCHPRSIFQGSFPLAVPG